LGETTSYLIAPKCGDELAWFGSMEWGHLAKADSYTQTPTPVAPVWRVVMYLCGIFGYAA